ncbi:MAG: pilus assembly protein CpaE, partial [Pirellulales bacterium]|nr:pilus assembly protein CpaE [Pirellulales bacterium]
MKNVLRLAIVDPDDASRDATKNMLLGMDVVWLEADCSRYDFFADVVAQTTPDIGLVALDSDPDRALQLVAQLNQQSPQCAILVTSSSSDGDLILRAMRSGVKEFLTEPVKIDDLLGALDRISEQRFGGVDNANRGCKVTAIAGATGGAGSTS